MNRESDRVSLAGTLWVFRTRNNADSWPGMKGYLRPGLITDLCELTWPPAPPSLPPPPPLWSELIAFLCKGHKTRTTDQELSLKTAYGQIFLLPFYHCNYSVRPKQLKKKKITIISLSTLVEDPYRQVNKTETDRHLVSSLVSALSSVNHKGLYQGRKQTSIYLLVTDSTSHYTNKPFFFSLSLSLSQTTTQTIATISESKPRTEITQVLEPINIPRALNTGTVSYTHLTLPTTAEV